MVSRFVCKCGLHSVNTHPLHRAPAGWLMRHKFIVVLFVYLAFLLILGLIQSREFKHFYSKYAPNWPWE